MSDPVVDALGATGGVLAVTAGRIEEALPALGRVTADVEQDWRDAAGRAWVDRAVQLRRTLDRELDAVLAAGRVVAEVVERLAEEAVRGPDGDPALRAAGDAAPQAGGGQAGGGPSGGGSAGGGSAGGGSAGGGSAGGGSAGGGSAVGGDSAARTGGAAPGAGTSWPGASTGTRRGGGPRLGGTDAQRVDEERGMRIAELDGQ